MSIKPLKPRPLHHPTCDLFHAKAGDKCSCGLDELRERVEKLERVREAAKEYVERSMPNLADGGVASRDKLRAALAECGEGE